MIVIDCKLSVTVTVPSAVVKRCGVANIGLVQVAAVHLVPIQSVADERRMSEHGVRVVFRAIQALAGCVVVWVAVVVVVEALSRVCVTPAGSELRSVSSNNEK